MRSSSASLFRAQLLWRSVHRSLIRRRKDHNNHLFALAGDSIYAEVARRGVPGLLGVFPKRCSRTQVSALHALLWAALVHVPREEFADRLRRRVAARGMDVAQRAVWLGAGLIASARQFTPAAVSFVEKGREPRARHILRFLVPGWLKEPAIRSDSLRTHSFRHSSRDASVLFGLHPSFPFRQPFNVREVVPAVPGVEA